MKIFNSHDKGNKITTEEEKKEIGEVIMIKSISWMKG